MALSQQEFDALRKRLQEQKLSAARAQLSQQKESQTTENLNPVQNVGVGVIKGGLSTLRGLGQIGMKIGTGLGLPQLRGQELYDDSSAIGQQVSERLKPQGAGQKIGYYGEKIAEFAAPTKYVNMGQRAVTGAINRLIPGTGLGAQFVRGVTGIGARALVEGGATGAVAYGQSGGDTQEAMTAAKLGAGGSAVLGTLGAGYRGVKNIGQTEAGRTFLSTTSGIPKKAIDVVGERGLQKGATPEGARDVAVQAVQGLRSKMTKEWNNAIPQIADEFAGTRTGLTDQQWSSLLKVADEFALDSSLLPKNPKNMSAVEAINLIKALNEVDSVAAKMSSKGAALRRLKAELRPQFIKAFGGENGSVAQLWKNYSTKAEILNQVNSIVNAYATKPTQMVTAKNRLMAIFDENKPEFLHAIRELEKEMGVDILSPAASSKFGKILPSGVLKSDGGLPTKAGIIDRLIKTIALPVTSPRIVGSMVGKSPAEQKEAGMILGRLFGGY